MNASTDHALAYPPAFQARPMGRAYNKANHGFSLVLVLATWCLLFIGAMVTSTNSGLAVPDWPTTYGQNMFLYPISEWKGGIFFEHGHRLFASLVGFLSLLNAAFFGGRDARKSIRWLSYAGLTLVIAQGLLGGLTVRMKLPMPVSAAHGGLAQLFFLSTVMLAVLTSRSWSSLASLPRSSTASPSRWQSGFRTGLAFLLLGYAQILVGAVMRHSFAGLAIPTFPQSFGQWWPSFWSFGIVFNFLHTRVLPCLLLGVLVLAIRASWKAGLAPARASVKILTVSLSAQIALGASVIWLHKAPVPTSAHVALAAVVMGSALALTLWNWKGAQA